MKFVFETGAIALPRTSVVNAISDGGSGDARSSILHRCWLPVTRSIGTERVEFSSASPAGTETRLIPPEWLKLLRLSQTVESSGIDRAERDLSGITG